MSRARRLGRLGGLAAVAVAATPFAWLWVVSMASADDPLTFGLRLDMAIGLRPGRGPAAGGRPCRRGGCSGSPSSGCWAGWPPWRWRSRPVRGPGPGWVVAGLGLTGVAACAAATTWYLAEHPAYARPHPLGTAVSLPPETAVVLAGTLAGCLWLALRPPRWLLGDRRARRFGVGMAVVLASGFVLASRLGLGGRPGWGEGTMGYLFMAPIVVLLTGSALAAAAGRSFRWGLWACAWAVLLAAPLVVAAWLVEAVAWHAHGRGLLLDGEGGLGVGANLADAVWWPLIFLTLWALPMGVLGGAAGAAVRRRSKPGKHP